MNNVLLLTGRILLSLLFLITGFMKFSMVGPMAGMLGQIGLPAPELLVYLMALCEIAGGLALIAGFQTRTVSILLAIWCVLTGLVAHTSAVDLPQLLKNIGMAGGFLVLAATTPGTFAWYGRWPERRPAASARVAAHPQA